MTDDSTDLVTKDGLPVTKGRIRPALDTAIRLIEEQGFTIADAAKSVGYRTHSLVQALHKPHVRAHRADVKRAWRESETAAAWHVMAKLARGACSEDVQHKSAKFIIDKAEEAAARTPEASRQLVQIIAQTVQLGTQLTDGQLSGVIEAQPWQAIADDASNSGSVGRPETGPDEGDDD